MTDENSSGTTEPGRQSQIAVLSGDLSRLRKHLATNEAERARFLREANRSIRDLRATIAERQTELAILAQAGASDN